MIDPLHRCSSGLRCLARTPDGACATSRPDSLCVTCLTQLQTLYGDLPALMRALRVFVAVPIAGKPHGESVSASKTPPSPMNAVVVDLRDDIAAILAHVGNVPMRDLITQDGGLETAAQIRKLHAQADKIIGLSEQWEAKAGPCGHCKTFTLGGFVGSGFVHCTLCATVTTADEYAHNNLIQIRER